MRTVRLQAIHDIHMELAKERKEFIPFREELNAPIRHLITEYNRLRKQVFKAQQLDCQP